MITITVSQPPHLAPLDFVDALIAAEVSLEKMSKEQREFFLFVLQIQSKRLGKAKPESGGAL